MIRVNETNLIRITAAIIAVVLVAVPVLILSVQTPGISRLPVQEAYSQGVQVNGYVSSFLPIIIVLAILFIAGLSTFGLYHGVTRELLGRRPLIHRPLAYIRERRRSI